MVPNSCKEAVNWTKNMDDALIDAFMVEYNEGRRVNDTFSSTAYDNIVKYVSALFGKHIDKDKVKNRWKTLKKNFSDVYDIFKNSSGFAWNPTTHVWDAEPEAWDALIEAKPKAAVWRTTPFPNFEKMMILYGVNRANGDEGETMQEWRKKRRSSAEGIGTISDFDLDADLFVEDNSPRQRASPEEGHSTHVYSACSKKQKRAPRENENFKELTQAIYAMVASLDKGNEAIIQGNLALQRASNNKREVPQLSGEELCKILEDCECDADKIPDIYCLLMSDDEKLRTAVQSPAPIRKQVIMKMFYASK